eukprot:2907233-Pyramimonas_sp.AAC.1
MCYRSPRWGFPTSFCTPSSGWPAGVQVPTGIRDAKVRAVLLEDRLAEMSLLGLNLLVPPGVSRQVSAEHRLQPRAAPCEQSKGGQRSDALHPVRKALILVLRRVQLGNRQQRTIGDALPSGGVQAPALAVLEQRKQGLMRAPGVRSAGVPELSVV